MFGYFKNHFKKTKNKDDALNTNESFSSEINENDSECFHEEYEEYENDDNDVNDDDFSLKENKNAKKTRKRTLLSKNKNYLYLFVGIIVLAYVLFITVSFLFSTPFSLSAKVQYIDKIDSYQLYYEIEELDNSINLKIGDSVCTPYGFTKTDSAVKDSSLDCLDGVVSEVKENRVKIFYNLPNYVEYESFFNLLDKKAVKPNKTFHKFDVQLKKFGKEYRIIKLIPKS